ncbi:MAG TPA: OmpH family outer membrane protein [Verrucomicrobiae bacterium]|nr:OmpH family outer membrane protein [Verrucomicrobiae bacterium]
MFSRLPVRAIVACAALFIGAQAGFAQLKIAVVRSQEALMGTAEVKKADAQMQATFKPRQDDLAQLAKEIDALTAQLQSGKLNDQQSMDAQNLLKRKQTEGQRKQDDLNSDVEAFRQDVLQKSAAKMQAVIKKLAEEKGYDLVIEANACPFVKPTLDITNDAIAAYDKANPVAAPAPPAGK